MYSDENGIVSLNGTSNYAKRVKISDNTYNQLSVRAYTGTPTLESDNYIFLQEDWDNNYVNVGINGKGNTGVNKAYTATQASYASIAYALNKAGTNTISSTANDTTANWSAKGTSIHWYYTSGCITDQPTQYGLLVNVTGENNEVHQLWLTQSKGHIWHRAGNANGWASTWVKMIDSTCFSLSGTTLTITI